MEDILISKFTTQIPRVGATPATPGFAESEGQDPVAPSGTPIQYGIGAGLSLDSLNQIQLGKTEPSYQLIDLKDFDVSGVSSLIIGYDDSVFYEDFIYADKINDDLQKSLTLTSIAGYKVNEAYFANGFNAEYILNVRNGSSLNSYNLRLYTEGISSIASFEDNINQKGLEYTADYESNFTARSLVTKQYVDGAISGAGHNPVTIGSPANGLSISGTQVLTIGLASTSATGALSSTDWNTFNGKIGGTISSGQVAFGTGTGTIGGDSGLVWDNVNKILSIATSASTTTRLEVFGGIRARPLANGSTIIGSPDSQNGIVIFANTASTERFDIRRYSNRISFLSSSSASAPGEPNGIILFNTGNVTLNTATDSGFKFEVAGNARFTTGLAVGSITPTNTLDVNGTARIRTINNLGSAATSVLVPSATGVVSLRTLAEFASDAGLTNFWTLVGSGIYRNSQVAIGRTTMGPSNATLTINSLGAGAGNAPIITYDVTGTVLGFVASKEGWIGSGISPTTNFESTRNTSGASASIICRQTNTAGTAAISLVNSAGAATYIGLNSPSYAASLGNIFFLGMATAGTNIILAPNLANTSSTTERTIFRNGGFSASFDIAYFDINGLFFSEAKNIAFGTTTGTKIGTATNQKIGFFNATPIIQPSGDILTALSNLGLVASPTITQIDQFSVKTTASADQTLPSGTLTILDYDSTLLNNSTATYTVGTTGRITINTTGIYTITAGVVIEADAVTALESAFLGIFRNGDLVAISSINTTIAAGAQSGLSTSTILSLTATDIIDCRALVNSVGGVANGLARRLGTLLGANATQVNSLSITKNSM